MATSTAPGLVSDIPRDPDRPSIHWIAILLLTLLIHALFMFVHFDWSGPAPMPRVDVQQVDPRKLEAIRKQWKEREKGLLLDKDKNAPKEKEKPKDARYMSDRNIRVEKEQRAREQNVIPKAGHPQNQGEKDQAKSESRPQSETRSEDLPQLKDLGVPFKFSKRSLARNAANRNQSSGEAAQGGDQSIRDKLPEGSENMLNAEESVFYSFYSRLYEEIGPLWQSKVREVIPRQKIATGNYTTSIDLVLDAQGNLIAVRRLQSSGVPEFDQVVDDAWRKIGRFPNPPQGLLNEKGEVHTGWTFTVQLNQETGIEYLPPERMY